MPKKKPTTPSKRDVEKTLAHYQALLCLDQWHISLGYQVNEGDTFAKISPAYEYMRAELNVNLELIESQDMLNKVIIHELCHCVLSPLCQTIAGIHEGDKATLRILGELQELVTTSIEKWRLWDIMSFKP